MDWYLIRAPSLAKPRLATIHLPGNHSSYPLPLRVEFAVSVICEGKPIGPIKILRLDIRFIHFSFSYVLPKECFDGAIFFQWI